MNSLTLQQINKLNKDFYTSIAEDFSKTRETPWMGWSRVVEKIKDHFAPNEKIDLLDVGCGNGRFCKYIRKNLTNNDVSYLGIDSNEKLIEIAKENEGNFEILDIFYDLHKIKEKFDVIVCFGVTHHMPFGDFFMDWLSEVGKLAKKGGLVIFTFWQFEKEPGDYLIGWDNKKGVQRFCHMHSETELKEIINKMNLNGFQLIDEFDSDRTNRYLLFRFI